MNLRKFDIHRYLTPPQIAGYIFSCLIPLAVFELGIIRIRNGWMMNISHLIAFVLLPCAASVWNFKLVRSDMSVFSRAIRIILLLIVFGTAAVTVIFWSKSENLLRYKNEQVVQSYAETVHRQCNALPYLSDIASFEQIEYYVYHGTQFIFSWDSYTLICRYNEADYANTKVQIDESYIFQQTPIQYAENICQPSAEINDYTFRMLDNSHTPYQISSYPQFIGLIGTNDRTREIVYMYFYDPDLDYIDSLPDFINESCGWKHIR